jgi:hypothetical protein
MRHRKGSHKGTFISMSSHIKNTERPNATSQTPRRTRTSLTQNKQERNNKNKGQNQ